VDAVTKAKTPKDEKNVKTEKRMKVGGGRKRRKKSLHRILLYS